MNRINMTLAAIAFALFAIAATTASPASVKGQTQMTFCKSQVQGSPNYDAVMPDGIELWGDSCFYYSGTINWNVYSYNLSKYNGNYYNHYAQESQVFGYDVCSNQTMAEYDMGGDGNWAYYTDQATAGYYTGTYEGCQDDYTHYHEVFAVGYEVDVYGMPMYGGTSYGASGWYID
jgi:hypothetical protein